MSVQALLALAAVGAAATIAGLTLLFGSGVRWGLLLAIAGALMLKGAGIAGLLTSLKKRR